MTAKRTFVFLIALGIGAVVFLSQPAEQSLSSAPPKIETIPDTTPAAQQDTSPVPLESAVNETEQLESFVCEPEVPSLDEMTKSRVEVDEDEVRKKLMASDQPQYLLAAAMLSPGSKEHPEALQKAFDANPNDPLTNWEVYLQCEKYSVHELCKQQDWLNRIIAVDSNNAKVWSTLAAHEYEQGQKRESLAALVRAGFAPNVSSYVSERLGLLIEALSATTDMDLQNRSEIAMGYVSAKVDMSTLLAQICKEEAAGSPQWIDACLRYGQTLTKSNTIMDQGIGYAIQLVSYEHSKDYSGTWAVLKESSELRKHVQSLSFLSDHFIDRYPLTHHKFIREYVGRGEIAALSQLGEFVRNLSSEELKQICR